MAKRSFSLTGLTGRLPALPDSARLLRLIALLVLVAQLGIVAHRIEHYLAPAQMESGEDGCDAFAPVSDAVALPAFLPPVMFVIFFLRFWAVREAEPRRPVDTLGFRAHAPPF